MRHKVIIVICLTISLVAPALAKDDPAKLFDQYRVDEIYKGKSHPLVLETAQDRLDGTNLKNAADKSHIDFAGHYKIAFFVCGYDCSKGAAFDAVTGKIVWFPPHVIDFMDYVEGISYCRNSRLIRFVGRENNDPGKIPNPITN